MGRIVTQVL